MAAPAAASLVARVSLPPRLRPTAASPLSSSVHDPRSRRRHLRLRRLPSPAGTAATSSPSVPSSSPETPGSGIGDALGDVEIYSAATGEPVLFRDLWDQNEVEMPCSSFVNFASTREISVVIFRQRLLKALQSRRSTQQISPFCRLESTKNLLHKIIQWHCENFT